MAAAQAPAHPVLDFSFNYGAAASSSAFGPQGTFQYCAVKATPNDLEVAPSSSFGVTIAVNTACIGILQNQPTLNGAAVVRMLGISKLVVDGSGTAITPGMWLRCDNQGRGVAIGAASSSSAAFALALQGSAAASDIISAFVLPLSFGF
jgi:hypothetical protein